ncbi:MAG TPA: transporter substrate-binding domain-containing protein [Caldimonas sp.]|nr:transporter substrate-binding domain-containing protein [Caldimonas sp.]
MALRRWALGAALAASLCAGAAGAQTLTVCMAEDNPPLSYRAGDESRGLDVRVAGAIAAELQRKLKIVPFESKYEQDSTLSQEVNALLSSGVCDLASGFALLAGDLGAPARSKARVPDYPGAKRPPQRPWVPLGTLVASRPYHAMAMALVVRDPARQSATLADPGDARIGVVTGTLAGTAVSLYRNGKLRPQIVTLAQNQNLLEQLEAERFDAALVALDRLDAWRLAHPATPLRRAAYTHPLRINIGFVALRDSADLVAAADRVIERATASGELQRWSEETGTTWVVPAEPAVAGAIGLADLVRE